MDEGHTLPREARSMQMRRNHGSPGKLRITAPSSNPLNCSMIAAFDRNGRRAWPEQTLSRSAGDSPIVLPNAWMLVAKIGQAFQKWPCLECPVGRLIYLVKELIDQRGLNKRRLGVPSRTASRISSGTTLSSLARVIRKPRRDRSRIRAAGGSGRRPLRHWLIIDGPSPIALPKSASVHAFAARRPPIAAIQSMADAGRVPEFRPTSPCR